MCVLKLQIRPLAVEVSLGKISQDMSSLKDITCYKYTLMNKHIL
jgi:hypothetical protein